MALSTPRPLWGWTPPARLWLAIGGAIAALGLIAGAGTGTLEGSPSPAPRLVVDPNTVPPEVLNALPKLGPALVDRIVKARDQAPFQSLDDFDARVRGIGPATIAALRPYLRIERPETPATPPVAGAVRLARSL